MSWPTPSDAMKRSEKAPGLPDFWLTLAQEARPPHGEDSWCRCFSPAAGLLAVFDGCGGLGAQRHTGYDLRQQQASCPNETEAYVASRLCAGAFYDAFRDLVATGEDLSEERFRALAAEYCTRVLTACRPGSGSRVLGSMVKSMPTTAAAALVLSSGKETTLCPIWAGDSRVYVLTTAGLAQLTTDDATVSDPMANLYEDGILRNVLTADRPPQLNHRQVHVKPPFLVFAATDGCFGYFSTPMEFEGVLLETLCASGSVEQWERALQARIAPVAGDDFTLALAAYGFGSFPALGQTLRPRLELLRRDYLSAISALPAEDRASREALWGRYKPNYLRYMKDGA